MSQFTMRKYVLSPLGEGEFTDMCEIFHVGQDPATGQIALWGPYDPTDSNSARRFKAFGDRDPLPVDCQHWGSVTIGPNVWHVFEVPAS
jgi:hypothetical protein